MQSRHHGSSRYKSWASKVFALLRGQFAGYIGSVGLLQVIKRVVQTLRQINSDLVYVCDPVLGDDGKLYLPLEMVTLYKTELLQLASVITPNQFEAEQLTGREVRTEQEALQACHYLLDQGPQSVVRHSPCLYTFDQSTASCCDACLHLLQRCCYADMDLVLS